MKNLKVTLFVAGMLASVATGVLADEARVDAHGREIVATTVRFDDLDLRKPEGAATLHWRLRMAAQNVCREEARDVRSQWRPAKCRKKALEDALANMPATVKTFHAQWVADGSKWLAPSAVRAAQVVVQR